MSNWLGDQLDNPNGSKGKPCIPEMRGIEDVAALLLHLHADKTAPSYAANRLVLMLVLPLAVKTLCARRNLS